jgi:cytochrome o ubiquinol oxidase subunit 3
MTHTSSMHSVEATSHRVTLGFWIYLMNDCLLFASLFATYAVLRGATAGGPTPAELFNLPLVFVQTLLLLTSSFTAGLALLAAQKDKTSMVMAALGVTLLLGLAFLAVEVTEFRHLLLEGHGPERSAFLSAFFALVGTHGLHVAAGSLWILVTLAHLARRGLIAVTNRRLLCFTLFWHFLDIVWIFVFTVVYLFGML